MTHTFKGIKVDGSGIECDFGDLWLNLWHKKEGFIFRSLKLWMHHGPTMWFESIRLDSMQKSKLFSIPNVSNPRPGPVHQLNREWSNVDRPPGMRNISICVNNLQNYRLNRPPYVQRTRTNNQHHVNYIWINRKCQYQISHIGYSLVPGARHLVRYDAVHGKWQKHDVCALKAYTYPMHLQPGVGVRALGGDEINICTVDADDGMNNETICVLIRNGRMRGHQRRTRGRKRRWERVQHKRTHIVWYVEWRDTPDTHQKSDKMKCLHSAGAWCTTTSNHAVILHARAMHECKSIQRSVWMLRAYAWR